MVSDHDGPKPVPTLALDTIHLGPIRLVTQRIQETLAGRRSPDLMGTDSAHGWAKADAGQRN